MLAEVSLPLMSTYEKDLIKLLSNNSPHKLFQPEAKEKENPPSILGDKLLPFFCFINKSTSPTYLLQLDVNQSQTASSLFFLLSRN